MEKAIVVLNLPKEMHVLDEIWDFIEPVSEGFPTYFYYPYHKLFTYFIIWSLATRSQEKKMDKTVLAHE